MSLIPGRIPIWRGGLSAFTGRNLHYEDPTVLVNESNPGMDEISRIFVRMGYDNLAGHLAAGFPAWFSGAKRSACLDLRTVTKLKNALPDDSLSIPDVRDINNRIKYGHIKGSVHIYAGELPERIQDVPGDRHMAGYRDTGYKGSPGASLLLKAGYSRVAISPV